MTYQVGKAVKGLVTSAVKEAEEAAAADAMLEKQKQMNESVTTQEIAKNAKNNLAEGAVRFATSFPGMKLVLADGRVVRFPTGVADLKDEKEIEQLRAAIRSGNRQIWEVK